MELFFHIFFFKSGNEFGFSNFPAFHFQDNDRNFFTQTCAHLHNLSGDTTAKIFLKNVLSLNELGANEFPIRFAFCKCDNQFQIIFSQVHIF